MSKSLYGKHAGDDGPVIYAEGDDFGLGGGGGGGRKDSASSSSDRSSWTSSSSSSSSMSSSSDFEDAGYSRTKARVKARAKPADSAAAGDAGAVDPAKDAEKTAAAAAAAGPSSEKSGALAKASKRKERALKAMAKVVASAFEDDKNGADAATLLDEEGSSLKVRMPLVFRFSGTQAGAPGLRNGEAPAPISISNEALKSMTEGALDGKAPVYVKNLDIVDTWSTFPAPLALHMTQIEGRDVTAYAHKTDGTPVTFVVLPGRHTDRHRVHQMSSSKLGKALLHGNARSKDAKRSMQLLSATHVGIVPDSDFGRWCKDNESKLVDPAGKRAGGGGGGGKKSGSRAAGSLVPDSPEIPLFIVSRARGMAAFKTYNKEVISSLPTTDFARHEVSLKRFDRPAGAQGVFGDVTDAPGLSPAQREHAAKSSHMAIVTVEAEFLNPAAIAKQLKK